MNQECESKYYKVGGAGGQLRPFRLPGRHSPEADVEQDCWRYGLSEQVEQKLRWALGKTLGLGKGKQVASRFWTEMFIESVIFLRKFDSTRPQMSPRNRD